MARAISSYLNSSDSRPSPSSPSQPFSSGTEETVQFMMMSSLLAESYESWLNHRCAFLARNLSCIHATLAQPSMPRQSGSSKSEPSSTSGTNDDLLPIVQPMLVYTGLIEQLQQFFKPRKCSVGPSSSGEGTSKQAEGGDDENGLEDREVVMKEKLLNLKEMVGFSKQLLSWLDDMTSAGDLQEAFHVIGALADLLSSGFKSCDEFVQAPINTARAK